MIFGGLAFIYHQSPEECQEFIQEMDYHEDSQSVSASAILSIISLIVLVYQGYDKYNQSLDDAIYLKLSHSKRMYYEHQ